MLRGDLTMLTKLLEVKSEHGSEDANERRRIRPAGRTGRAELRARPRGTAGHDEAAAGALYVWVVYPETGEVEVWREPARAQVVLQETDLLEAADLLPGFVLPIGALFG